VAPQRVLARPVRAYGSGARLRLDGWMARPDARAAGSGL